MVAGHVDGVGQVTRISTRDDARLLDLSAPPEVLAASIPLGSVTVDGVSLTINALPGGGMIQVSLIPHTLAHTTLSDRKVGDRVHLEGDTIGKYVKQLMSPPRAP
jgi:riboflavin synthase